MGDYRVEWWEEAVDDLARLWVKASDRARVSLWATGIDEALARQPESKGAQVAEGLRYLQFGGIRAYFTVSPNERLVEVVGIRPARL